MNLRSGSPLSKVLLFLLDTVLAWALAASTAMLFHRVMLNPFPDGKILIVCAIAVPLLMLFMKNRPFKLITLFLIAASALAILGLFLLSLFFSGFLSTWTNVLSAISGLATSVNTPPLIVVLLTSLLASLIVAKGKRLIYLFVLLPPIALIILSFFYADFPPHVLAIYTVSSIALVLRKKYDWFLSLLSNWPSTSEILNGGPYENSSADQTRAAKAGGKVPPARIGHGFPNELVRALLLTVTAAVIAFVFRPVPTPGPMFGSDLSQSIELKFQSFLESSDFLSELFGLKSPGGSIDNKRSTGTYGELGGPADLGNDPILLVKSSRPGIYLRGFTYGDYTRNRWIQDPVDPDEAPLYGDSPSSRSVTVPFGDKLIRYNPGWLIQYTYYSSATIERFWTSRKQSVAVQYLSPYDARFGVFAPPLTRTMNFFDEKYDYYTSPSDLRLRLSAGKNILYHSDMPQPWAAYALEYMDIGEDAVNSFNLYEFCVPGYYDRMANNIRELNPGRYYFSFFERELAELQALSDYSSEAMKTYTRLPSTVSPEVLALAETITADIPENEYWRRAVAIKNFLLSGTFEYSLTPEKLPEGTDILDQFLFKEQKGYCTYFATAMTVLARAAGVPARYVEGFYVNSDTLTDDGLYLLTEQNLHAWCEIYMEGLGFVPIEATAGFGRIIDPNGPTAPASSQTPPSETASPEPPTEEPSATPDISALPSETIDPELPTASPVNTPAPTDPPVRSDPVSLPAAIKILIIMLFPAILILLLLLLLNHLATRRPGRSGSPSERVVSVYRRSSALMRELGYRRRAQETPREFADRLKEPPADNKKALPNGAVEAFDRLTGMYETALYGDSSKKELVYADAVRCWNEIVTSLEQSRGKLKTRIYLIHTIGK